MELDLDIFRASGPPPAVTETKASRVGLPGQTYLGSKPPMWWLCRSHTLGKAALATGLALWFSFGLRKGRPGPITVNSAIRRQMGLSKDQARRGVHALKKAKLVRVSRGGRGRCAMVEIVTEFAEPSVPPVSAPDGRASLETFRASVDEN